MTDYPTYSTEQVKQEIDNALSYQNPYDESLRYESDMLWAVGMRMIERGGSFVSYLGELYFRADGINQKKILAIWPDYFLQYAE